MVTNSMTTLKMVHIKKNLQKNLKVPQYTDSICEDLAHIYL